MARFQNLLKNIFGWAPDKDPTQNLDTWANELVGLGKHEVSMESMYYDKMILPYTRESMYQLYEELDELSEVAGVVTGYAQDASQRDTETDKTIWIESDTTTIENELNYLLDDTLQIEDWCLACLRDLAKYGDEFPVLNYNDKEGVIGIKDWPQPIEIKRIENKEGTLLGFLDDRRYKHIGSVTAQNLEQILMKPWDIVHFRNKMQNKVPSFLERWVYGTSMLYGIRRSGRRMLLYSDLLFLYRLRNSFDRRIYYIDVGTEDLNQAVKILKKWRRALEKDQYVNWDSNMFRATQNPWTLGEAIFWPRRMGSTSTVDTIAGNPNVADMADLDREQNALFAGLNAPKEYFGFGAEGGIFERDKGLTLKDMRWGRAVAILQRAFKNGIKRICEIHLALKGINTKDPVNAFKVCMVAPSTLEVLQNLSATAQITEMASAYFDFGNNLGLNNNEWKKHTLKKFFSMTDDDISKYLAEPSPEVPTEGGGGSESGGGAEGEEGAGGPEEGPIAIPGEVAPPEAPEATAPETPETPAAPAPVLTASFEPLPSDRNWLSKRLTDNLNGATTVVQGAGGSQNREGLSEELWESLQTSGLDMIENDMDSVDEANYGGNIDELIEGSGATYKGMTPDDLMANMDHKKTLDRSNHCLSRMKKFDSRKGVLEFVTTCHPFKTKHLQHIKFANWEKNIPKEWKYKRFAWNKALEILPDLKDWTVKVNCGCPAFLWWGSEFNLTNMSAALDPIQIAPNIRDPKRERTMCKHLVAVVELLQKEIE